MRILYILRDFPVIYSQVFVLNEIIELTKRGHEIIILSEMGNRERMHGEVLKKNLLKKSIYIIYPKFSRGRNKLIYCLKLFFINSFIRPTSNIDNLKFAIKKYPYLWEILDDYVNITSLNENIDKLKNLNLDLIHIPFPESTIRSAKISLPNKLNLPFTATYRTDFYTSDKEHIIKRLKYIKKPKRIITISEYNRKHLKRILGIKDVEVIHSAIDTNKFRPINTIKKRKIFLVSRFIEKKGIEYLIKVCKLLNDEKVKVECIIAGEGPLKEVYERLIIKYKLSNKVIIKDSLTQEEIKKELEDSMVFVLPCIIASDGNRDGLPNVLKEAMAMEIPVITSDICGIEELIEDGKSGILVPPKNPEAIAKVIKKLFSDSSLRKKIGKEARKKIIKDFNIKKEAEKLEKIFYQAIKNESK